MNYNEVALSAVLWVILGSGIIQFSPIKFNPWTWIGKQIAKALTGEVIEKIKGLDEKIDKIEKNLDEDRAITARVRILRFNDEILQDVRHSKESFDQCLSDIDTYEKYCDANRDFKNNKTGMAIKNIEVVYQKCMKDRDFL